MKINNFDLIKNILNFQLEKFYYLQIICRGKDCGENKIINSYFIRTKEQLEKLEEEIIFLCEHYKARAYINPNIRSFYELQRLLLVKLSSLIYDNNVQNPKKTLGSAVNSLKSTNPIWIIDLDDTTLKDEVLLWLDNYFKLEPEIPFCSTREELYLKGIIPTKQGLHLLTSPFNLKSFNSKFKDIDVHKNSGGTLLYYPSSI